MLKSDSSVETSSRPAPWLHEQEARALGFELKYELFDFKARGLEEMHSALRCND